MCGIPDPFGRLSVTTAQVCSLGVSTRGASASSNAHNAVEIVRFNLQISCAYDPARNQNGNGGACDADESGDGGHTDEDCDGYEDVYDLEPNFTVIHNPDLRRTDCHQTDGSPGSASFTPLPKPADAGCAPPNAIPARLLAYDRNCGLYLVKWRGYNEDYNTWEPAGRLPLDMTSQHAPCRRSQAGCPRGC